MKEIKNKLGKKFTGLLVAVLLIMGLVAVGSASFAATTAPPVPTNPSDFGITVSNLTQYSISGDSTNGQTIPYEVFYDKASETLYVILQSNHSKGVVTSSLTTSTNTITVTGGTAQVVPYSATASDGNDYTLLIFNPVPVATSGSTSLGLTADLGAGGHNLTNSSGTGNLIITPMGITFVVKNIDDTGLVVEEGQQYSFDGTTSSYLIQPGDSTADVVAPSVDLSTGWEFVTPDGTVSNDVSWDQTVQDPMPDNSVTITAYIKQIPYTVTYNYTGDVPAGVTAPSVPSTVYGAGQTVAAVPATVPGYTFNGWVPTQGLQPSDIDSSGNFTMPNNDVVFTGNWTKNTNPISYAYTGTIPTNAPAVPSIVSAVYLSDQTVADNPTMPGYTFTGWVATPESNLSSSIGAGSDFTMPDNAVAFTGSWEPNTNTVTYSYADPVPTDAPAVPSVVSAVYLSDQTVAADPTMPGYTFSGWVATPASNLPSDIVAGSDFNMPDNPVVFTGSWAKDTGATKTLSYTVEYYKDGVLVPGDTDTVTQDVWVNDSNTLSVQPVDTYAGKYPGYKFDSTDPDPIPATIADGGVIKVYYVKDDSATKTLSYTVEYYKDGVLVPGDTETVTQNVWVNDPTDTLTVQTVDTSNDKYPGYTLDSSATGSIPETIADGGVIEVYYAQIPSYNVIYNGNGNTSGTTVVTNTYAQGAPVTVPGPGNLAKTNYIFSGWSTNADATVADATYAPGSTFTMPANDVNLYAVWKYDVGPQSNNSSTATPGGTAATTTTTTTAPPAAVALDTTDHFAYIIGYPNGTVKPGGNITRAEVATIFFRLLTDSSRSSVWQTTNSYKDVPQSKWFNNAISTLSNAGIIKGYPNGKFMPNASITRAEFAAMAARFATGSPTSSVTFSDLNGNWATNEIYRAAGLGWVTGYPDGTFRPNQSITRAEAMSIINRVLDRSVTSTSDLLSNMHQWSDNSNVSAWYYFDVQEATNSHDYVRNADGTTEKWTAMIADPDWKALEQSGLQSPPQLADIMSSISN